MNPRIRKRPTDAKPRQKVRPGIWLPLLISTPFIGMAVYASITREFGSLVLLSVLVIIAGLIAWLIFRIQKLEIERDRALAWSGEAEWRASNLHLLQSSQVGPPDSVQHLHQLHDLQAEINALRARELVLEKQAHYDELTELPNRTLLRDRFSSAVERSKRSNTLFAVLMVDLNGFKVINDKYGHEVGDFVLVTTAHRILGALRALDTVARLGGDEFVLIVEGVSGSNDFEQVGKKLIEVLFEPINLPSGEIIGVGASLGMSVFPHNGADLTTLLAVADQAMYQCKATGLIRLY
jgi:diguanylate cyclase (GGDEF)-like protein